MVPCAACFRRKLKAAHFTGKPFTPASYRTLFDWFASMPRGVHFQPGLIAFEFAGDAESACNAIFEHLHEGDEATVFELCGGAWRFDRLKNGEKRDAQLKQFLGLDTN